jgi:hypothetical protein
MKPSTKTSIVIDLPEHVADAVVELSKTIDLGTLLRDALGEFASRRKSSETYVTMRYPSLSSKARASKIDKLNRSPGVARRIALAEAIHSGVARVETIKLPELKQCQGINNYKTGWYVQGAAGFQCEHGEGHDVAPGEYLHVNADGHAFHVFCEAHAKP